MTSPEQQKAVSEHIEEVTKKSSGIMNSDDVKMTSEIIDKLVEYDDATKLDEDVRMNSFQIIRKNVNLFVKLLSYNLYHEVVKLCNPAICLGEKQHREDSRRSSQVDQCP